MRDVDDTGDPAWVNRAPIQITFTPVRPRCCSAIHCSAMVSAACRDFRPQQKHSRLPSARPTTGAQIDLRTVWLRAVGWEPVLRLILAIVKVPFTVVRARRRFSRRRCPIPLDPPGRLLFLYFRRRSSTTRRHFEILGNHPDAADESSALDPSLTT
jgi:hypothetical protein